MKILIVDDYREVAECVEYYVFNIFSQNTFTKLAFSAGDAIRCLKEKPGYYDLCICDHDMGISFGNEVLNYLVESSSATRFVLCSTFLPRDNPAMYPSKYVFYNIQKPDVFNGLRELKILLEERMQFESNEFFL
ncbi:MAG: response regulator [Bacteriovoracaceae bacterium]|nr:response regulator [Bacteriovoracaceae bacterium]